MPALEAELIQCRSALTPASGFLWAYTHTLNPYMGCAWGAGGCGVYCYVAHSPIGLYAKQPWGHWLRAKANAAEALVRDLARVPDSRNIRVFMSSATDPYQPAEARLRITRSVLRVFRDVPVGVLVVQTRSPLVEQDFDLLRDMPFVRLSMTVETDDDVVRSSLTPTCPGIDRRLTTMRKARDLGIFVQAAVSPTLPHSADRFADLLAGAADRVIVDTVFGDGAEGKRTRKSALPARMAELGYPQWDDLLGPRQLYAVLQERLGAEHVTWAQTGFNALAVEAKDAYHRDCLADNARGGLPTLKSPRIRDSA